MTVSNKTLIKIAAWGGFIVSTTGFFLQNRLIDRFRDYDYYKLALKRLRTHPGAVYYLGEPIKDKRFKITDPGNNYSDDVKARFSIPVSGPKDKGTYHIWAMKDNKEWKLIKAELDIKSKPDARLVIERDMTEVRNKVFVGTSREKFFYHNTLLCLVKALQGKNVTMDLRNDSYVCGNVSSVDGYMNISFTNAVFCDPQGNEFSFEELFVQGRNIRYVHVPEDLSLLNTIRGEFVKSNRELPQKPTQTSRKVKKAMKQHMQIVASLDV